MKTRIENPFLMTDVYKTGHEHFYGNGLTKIYSYLTTRSNKKFDHVVYFGAQAIVKKAFSKPPTKEMVDEFIEYHQDILGTKPSDRMIGKLIELSKLGYWPLRIKSLPEGKKYNHRTCLMTVTNTHPNFAWLVGFFESMLLKVWNTSTVATNSAKYHDLVVNYAKKTCDNIDHIPFSVHDFGYRGTSSEETSELSGMAHLIPFMGTDTIPAVWGVKNYYGCEGPIGLSVMATEHSTMSQNIMYVMDILKRGGSYITYSMNSSDFQDVFKRDLRLFAEALVWKEIINVKVPTGIVSIVADTYDYFGVLEKVLPWLKEDILKRDGKVVVRPDSGVPQNIIMKTLPILQEVFGSNYNDKGYKVLNPKIGLIYGDGMFYDRFESILGRMASLENNYATSNLTIGVGGLLLQQHSRDDLGFAVKATYAEVDGHPIEVYKDPATDPGKKSHKGLMKVVLENGEFVTYDQIPNEENDDCQMNVIFEDSEFFNQVTFNDVRLNYIGSHFTELSCEAENE